MTDDEAMDVLKEWIKPDGGLFCLGQYVAYTPGESTVVLDAEFSIDELEAIVWWMKNAKANAV